MINTEAGRGLGTVLRTMNSILIVAAVTGMLLTVSPLPASAQAIETEKGVAVTPIRQELVNDHAIITVANPGDVKVHVTVKQYLGNGHAQYRPTEARPFTVMPEVFRLKPNQTVTVEVYRTKPITTTTAAIAFMFTARNKNGGIATQGVVLSQLVVDVERFLEVNPTPTPAGTLGKGGSLFALDRPWPWFLLAAGGGFWLIIGWRRRREERRQTESWGWSK